MKQSPARKQARAFAVAAAKRLDAAIQAYLYTPRTSGTADAESAYLGARSDFVRDGLAYFLGKRTDVEARQRRARRKA